MKPSAPRGERAAWVRRPPRDVLHRGLTLALRGDRPPSIDMTQPQPHNPLHGVTLQMILEHLVAQHGWEQLGRMINIRCFKYDPSIKSSLQFLRRTPWARQQVEALYLRDKAKPSP
ncbi:VF530 family protein [Sorangium sp. So ce693]